MMKNIYLIRPKGFNIGNDAIYLAVCHFIQKAFTERCNIISLPATGKYEAQRKAGLSSQTIYELNQSGDGLVIGGGNLYENGELEVNPIAIKAMEKPMMIFSVSRGRIFNQNLKLVGRTDTMSDDNLIILNKNASISLSRDIATKKYLDGLGCENLVGGCPTLFINELSGDISNSVMSFGTDCLISIRTPSLMSIPVKFQYALRNQLIELIDLLKNKGYVNIKFLCHDYRDIPFAASFDNIDYIYTDNVYFYLSYLKNTKLNLSFRLHSFIPCIAYGVPSIKISYDERAISVLETIGLDEWNINLLTDNLIQEVKNRLNNLRDLNTIKKKCKNNQWKELKNIIVDNCMLFAKIVDNPQ